MNDLKITITDIPADPAPLTDLLDTVLREAYPDEIDEAVYAARGLASDYICAPGRDKSAARRMERKLSAVNRAYIAYNPDDTRPGQYVVKPLAKMRLLAALLDLQVTLAD